jgi:superfamily II DNA helicase RecQ
LYIYEWQIDVSEALLLGLDCSVIAGTGAGKTMPFVMPLFIESEKIMIVISLLNVLEEDQVMHFPSEGDWTVTFFWLNRQAGFKNGTLCSCCQW